MVYVALAVSVLSLIVSIWSLTSYFSLRRRLQRPPAVSSFSDELLTRDAWLEELEERGQAVLARIEAAEQRLKSAQPTQPAPAERAGGGLAAALRHGDVPDRSAARPSEAAPVRLEQASVREQVARLAQQGLDVTAIAQKLQLGRGEVELFLGLVSRDDSGK